MNDTLIMGALGFVTKFFDEEDNRRKEGRMTCGVAAKWLTSLMEEIGRPEHHDLWGYEQALSEIKELLENYEGLINNLKGEIHDND